MFKKTPGCSFDCILERTYPVETENIIKDGKTVQAIVGYHQKMGAPYIRPNYAEIHVIDYQPNTGTGDFYYTDDFIIMDEYDLPDELFEI